MIKILNFNLMQLNISVSDVLYDTALGPIQHVLLNFMGDPSNIVETTTYRKDPIASVILTYPLDMVSEIFKNETITEQIAHRVFSNRENLDRYINQGPTMLVNKYEDAAKYADYTSYFNNDPGIIFSTVLTTSLIIQADEDNRKNPDETFILIGAIPFKGVMRPILKSVNYKIYNGQFIPTNHFLYDPERSDRSTYRQIMSTYSKIAYLYVNVFTSLQIDEFLDIEYDADDPMSYYLDDPTDKDVDKSLYGSFRMHLIYPACDTAGDLYQLVDHINSTFVPFAGREELFEKPNQNLFTISNWPERRAMRKIVMRDTND